MKGISDFRVGEGLERMRPNRSPQVSEHFDICPSSIARRLPGKGHAIVIGRQGDRSLRYHSTEAVLIIK